MRKKKIEIENVNLLGRIVFILFGSVFYITGNFIGFEGLIIKDKLIVIIGFESIIIGMIFFSMSMLIPLIKNDKSVNLVGAIMIKLRG